MTRFEVELPGRSRRGRPGWLLLILLALAACEQPPGPQPGPELDLGTDTARLPSGASIHEVVIRSDFEGAIFEPHELVVRPGDVVRFTAGDAGNHAIAFDEAGLTPEARSFLESTYQLRGPPLITAGAVWVVSFDGAPPGDYPFVCLTYGGTGRITVQTRAR